MTNIPDSPGLPNERDLFGWTDRAPPAIEAGIIGWDGDDDHADMGTESNEGVTLIKVQLFRGMDPLEDVKPGVAQGTKILARLSGFPFWCVPPAGLECFVAFPSGFETTPGAGVIVALPGANPFVQFSKTRAKIDVGKDTDLVFKGRSVALVMYNPDTPEDGPEDFISVSPEGGLQMGSRDGLGVVIKDGTINLFVPDGGDAKSVIRISKTAIEMVQKNASDKTAMFKLEDNNAWMNAEKAYILAGGGLLGFKAGSTPVALLTSGGPSLGWATIIA